jgi:thiamine kinase
VSVSSLTGPAADAAGYRDLDAILDRIPVLAGHPRQVETISGGLTNRNFKVTNSAGRRFVVRLSSAQSALLAIDREHEYRNTMAAARSGVAPAVAGYLPGAGVLVIEWIDGKTFGSEDLDDDATLGRLAAACRQLHAGPRFVSDFDMFEVQRGYLDLATARGFRLPPRYLDFMTQVARIREALAVRDTARVPCHNDLLAANIMDDGQRLWLIDYEYAGNNDPCFELGNIWSEADLGLDHLETLVTAYYGHRAPEKVARARLLGLMSKYGWTLWASIQDSTSDLDFDFWSWGMEKYDRAAAEFDGPDFDQLITEVQQ